MKSKKSVHLTVMFLIIANIYPLIGVLFLNWNISNLLLLYWLESGIIGFYSVIKSLWSMRNYVVPINEKHHFINFVLYRLLLPLCYFGVYITYMSLTSMIISLLVGTSPKPPIGVFSFMINLVNLALFQQIQFALIGLFLSHTFSFFINFIFNKEYKKAKEFDQLNYFVNRSMVLVYTFFVAVAILILFGLFAVLRILTLSTLLFSFLTLIPLIALVLVKIYLDIKSHIKIHSNQSVQFSD